MTAQSIEPVRANPGEEATLFPAVEATVRLAMKAPLEVLATADESSLRAFFTDDELDALDLFFFECRDKGISAEEIQCLLSDIAKLGLSGREQGREISYSAGAAFSYVGSVFGLMKMHAPFKTARRGIFKSCGFSNEEIASW